MANDTPVLTSQNLEVARRALIIITQLFDRYAIPYHLEGGTLLGIVRDNDLLPWDHDIDISIPKEYIENVENLKLKLLLRGYKLSSKMSKIQSGPFNVGDQYIFKIKPLLPYMVRWVIPNYIEKFIVLDVFIKIEHETFTYWQAKRTLMRVENKYYKSFETIEYRGHSLKVPNHYRDYLAQKYGDWSVPVKEWDCGENELTIVKGERIA